MCTREPQSERYHVHQQAEGAGDFGRSHGAAWLEVGLNDPSARLAPILVLLNRQYISKRRQHFGISD